jgi:class 3 adenylate cyclase
MALEDDLKKNVQTIFSDQWEATSGRVVPEPSSVTLGNTAIEFESATVLYADLDGSTAMVDEKTWQFSAEIYKAYLECAARLIKAKGGEITAYDGDRVMAVFIGDSKNTSAMLAALNINWAVSHVINPAVAKQYPNTDFMVKHSVGIDASSIRAARIGVRGANDLVWVGRAANYAAKLTAVPSDTSCAWITKEVFDVANESAKFHQGESMWKKYTWTKMGDMEIYRSTWWKSPT